MNSSMKPNEKAEKKSDSTALKMLFTALLLLVCSAVYLFSESGYNEPVTPAPAEEEALENTVFKESFCKRAFASQNYSETNENAYQIESEAFDTPPTAALSTVGGIVKAFTLELDMPICPEEPKNATPIDERLFKERKERYFEQKDWIEKSLPNMIRALDVQERLTESDITYMLYIVDTAIDTGKAQNTDIAQYRLRAYSDLEDEGPRLYISLQDEKNISEDEK